jgi:hypothetical protein
MQRHRPATLLLGAIVLAHLVVSVVHGRAHAGADVPLSPAATTFVWIVILAGPLIGLGLSSWRPAAAGWVVAASMGASLLFGLVNHFVVASPDHVSHVAAPWHATFAATAVLLVVTEAAGVGVGLWHATRRMEWSA